jgi:hypothetical protein
VFLPEEERSNNVLRSMTTNFQVGASPASRGREQKQKRPVTTRSSCSVEILRPEEVGYHSALRIKNHGFPLSAR